MIYKEIIKQWSNKQQKSEEGKKKKVILVAIARKGPRLCELESDCIKDKLKFDYIISEHAIPFSLSDFKDSLVVLTDEAVYFGSTFQRIHTVLKTGITLSCESSETDKSSDSLKAAPIAISEKASSILHKSVEWLVPASTIKKEEVPEYINSLIEAFYTLGKPFDIEFPIFYAHMPEPWKSLSNKEIASNLEKILENVGLNEEAEHPKTYRLHHTTSNSESYYTVTRLITNHIYENNKTIHSDFIKIRVFWNKDRIAFTFYAPHIIDDKYLSKDTPLFRNTPYQEIWTLLWDEAHCVKEQITEARSRAIKDNVHDINYNLEEYLYHTKRSLLIWANYLFSFDLAKKLIPSLKERLYANERISAEDFSPDDKDICYLSGKVLLEKIRLLLDKALFSDKETVLPTVPMEDIQIGNYIPEAYKDYYDLQNIQDLPECKNMSELISTLFYNMHNQVELKGRENWKENLGRLRFGETFSSIYNRAFIRNFKDDIYTSMHKAIDFRIDNGSIVPKYICKTDNNGTAVWTRVFRCGENEDLYSQQLIRFMTRVFRTLSEMCDSNLLSIQQIYGLTSMLLLDPPMSMKSIFKNESLPWNFVCQWKDFGPEVFFINELDDDAREEHLPSKRMTDLVDFCIRKKLLKESEINGFYTVSPYLPTATEKKWQELTMAKTAYITNFLTSDMDGISIQDMTEWLLYSEKVMVEARQKLLDWCYRFPELTDKLKKESTPISEFNALNLTYPWKEVEVMAKLEKLADANPTDNLKTWIHTLQEVWTAQVDSILGIKFFKENRERGDMMYNLLTCCLYYDRTEYRKHTNRLAEDLDRYRKQIGDPLCNEHSFKTIIENKDYDALKKAYRSFIATISNDIRKEEQLYKEGLSEAATSSI